MMNKATRFELIEYDDVWAAEEGGWQVNNSHPVCDDLYITDDATDKDICEYLKQNGYLTTSDMRRLMVTNYGDMLEICTRKGEYPLYGLHVVY